MSNAPELMTRFEASRIVGMRAMQLAEHGQVNVTIDDVRLRNDFVYAAALELAIGRLDACVRRGDRTVHVSELILPPDVYSMLDARDGGERVA